jgi:hypothetical protein
MRGKVGAGSVLALDAIGMQDTFLINKNMDDSQWDPNYTQTSNFAITQRVLELPGNAWIGQEITMEILPKSTGDLISNMHLKCSLPALQSGYIYTDQIGRAVIQQVDFMIDGQVIESLTDDWYIIRDQIILDADEKNGLAYTINGGYAEGTLSKQTNTPQIDMMIPLDLFFCRRHSKNNKNRERLEKPYFPMCAIYNQRVYLKIKFNNWSWFSNATTAQDFTHPPQLILEEIQLNESEKQYIKTHKRRIVVNHVYKNPPLYLNQGIAGQFTNNLGANFPVSAMAWFIRRTKFETDPQYVNSRYTYGYTTDNISTGIPVTFFNGVQLNYVDVISRGRISLDGNDIIDTNNGTYFSINQPMEHGLSIPTKNIYLYCFGLSPKEYNQGGYLDFSPINSSTSVLDIQFNPLYAAEISQAFTAYLYYYGYTILEISNGSGKLAFL